MTQRQNRRVPLRFPLRQNKLAPLRFPLKRKTADTTRQEPRFARLLACRALRRTSAPSFFLYRVRSRGAAGSLHFALRLLPTSREEASEETRSTPFPAKAENCVYAPSFFLDRVRSRRTSGSLHFALRLLPTSREETSEEARGVYAPSFFLNQMRPASP